MVGGRRRGTKLLLEKLLPSKPDSEQTEKVASALLQGHHPSSNKPLYLKGVHNGRFYRVKLQQQHRATSAENAKKHPMTPLPGDGEVPHAFHKVRSHAASHKKKQKLKDTTEQSSSRQLRLPGFLQGGGEFSYEESIAYLKAWWEKNWSTVVLNFGSVCTLIGFTRSDVLELRCLSVTGSAANVIYHFTQMPLRYLPVCWSALFAMVNSFKIREILLERHQEVHMTPQQEDIYIQFFMPHGITPRQFQVLQESAKEVVIPSGEAIIKQGEVCDHVSLVVSGSTRASISGRRLTAASAIAPNSITAEEKAGGNSGAWVGEMNFLEYYHKKVGVKGAAKKKMAASAASPESTEKKTASQTTTEVEKSENNPQTAVATTQKEPESKVEAAAAKDDTTGIKKAAAVAKKEEAKETESPAPHKRAKKEEVELPPINRYTIVADDECVVWQWSFDQMEAMMKRSTDFRAALTRAITASIVSKVVNFTVSKTSALPTWSTWLDDWKYNAGASVNVKTDEEEDSEEELDELNQSYQPDASGIDEHGEF